MRVRVRISGQWLVIPDSMLVIWMVGAEDVWIMRRISCGGFRHSMGNSDHENGKWSSSSSFHPRVGAGLKTRWRLGEGLGRPSLRGGLWSYRSLLQRGGLLGLFHRELLSLLQELIISCRGLTNGLRGMFLACVCSVTRSRYPKWRLEEWLAVLSGGCRLLAGGAKHFLKFLKMIFNYLFIFRFYVSTAAFEASSQFELDSIWIFICLIFHFQTMLCQLYLNIIP